MTKKRFYVGISCPYMLSTLKGRPICGWDVAENLDYLSPDLLAKFGKIEVPLLRIEAKNEVEAVKEYKKQIPEVKKFKLRRLWLPG